MPSGRDDAPYNLTSEEISLVVSYRLCNADRQDVLLHLAHELVRQSRQKSTQPVAVSGHNVYLLSGRKLP